MALLDIARKRLQAVLDEINRVADYEFPYKDSGQALRSLRQVYSGRLGTLASLNNSSNQAVLKQACSLALRELFDYLPLLGFVVRSTNVRNAFEVFRPILGMARAVLEPGTLPNHQYQTQLVLSSEWDYSPLTYSEIPGLPGFVLIGLPAPESSNPLLIPLAGHELGHSAWTMNNRAVDYAISPVVRQQVIAVIRQRWNDFTTHFPGLGIAPAQVATDLAAIACWNRAASWGQKQAEEIFCDCLGLRLFGASYLEAFAYLLAPCIAGERPLLYPNTLARVAHLSTAAGTYGVPVPAGYQQLFEDNTQPPLAPADDFLLSVADQAVGNAVAHIVGQANQVVANSGLPAPTDAEAARILAKFDLVVPAEKCAGLPDILNAAWRAFNDPAFWQNNPQISSKKDEVLKELVLKNIELFEIERIIGAAP